MADDQTYNYDNAKTGQRETRVDKPTTFPYMNPSTGQIEQRSVYPGLFARIIENFKDPAAVDIQRQRYLDTLGLMGKSAPNATTWQTALKTPGK